MLSAAPLWLRPWLRDRTSLTRRLQQHSGGDFAVTVLKQCWERPRLHEARLLGVSPQQYVLVREVILQGRGQPWVYARSVLPRVVMTGRLHFLRTLGNRPLGALLFNNTAIRRERPVAQRYAAASLPSGLQAAPGELWGRYSIFRHGVHGMLVSEVFLPTFVDSVMLPT